MSEDEVFIENFLEQLGKEILQPGDRNLKEVQSEVRNQFEICYYEHSFLFLSLSTA
jgi:hypothetical protein